MTDSNISIKFELSDIIAVSVQNGVGFNWIQFVTYRRLVYTKVTQNIREVPDQNSVASVISSITSLKAWSAIILEYPA